jgi:HTH-type transcriptional regulator, glycine betaine synthesis regulator
MADEKDPSPIEDWQLKVADSIGGLMEFWGFKRAMGRMWAVMYLSPQSMTAQELGDRLTMSAGAVSMALAELTKWGVVKKSWRPGDRRDWYEPETSIWKMVSRVYRERELVMVRAAIETFEHAIRAVGQERGSARPEEKKRLKFMQERLQSLLGLARLGQSLLSSIVDGQRIDPTPIKTFFGG